MAALAWNAYSNAAFGIVKGQFNLATDTIVVTLHTNTYVPNADTHILWSSASATELGTAGGYTAGGKALVTLSTTLTTNTVKMDADDPTWTTFSAGPFRYALLTRRAGGSLVAGDLLLGYSDLTGGGTLTGAGGTYTIVLDTLGIFSVTHTP